MPPPAPSDPEPTAGGPPPALSPRHREALDAFVHLWGEMGSAWGINRTMAQIHALLFASNRPLDTDEIMGRLGISRGNANMNLRSLVEWQLVRKTAQPGSRKDFYHAEKDVWAVTATIIAERRRREIRPVEEALRASSARLREGAAAPTPEEAYLAQRLDSLVLFLDVFDDVSRALLPLLDARSAPKIRRLARFAASLRAADPAAEPPTDDA